MSAPDPHWKRAVMVAAVFALRHGESWVPAAIQEARAAQRYAETFLATHGLERRLSFETSDDGVRLRRVPGWTPTEPLPSVPDPV